MPIEQAAFILDGDATQTVREMHRASQAFRDAEKEIRKLTKASREGNKEALPLLDAAIKKWLELGGTVDQLTSRIKAFRREQKEAVSDGRGAGVAGLSAAIQRTNVETREGVKETRRYRESLNQLAYGIGDVMSVQGGMAEMIRASANNVQYLVSMIPGAFGAFAMVGAVVAQGVGMMVARMADGRSATKGLIETNKEAEKSFHALRESIDKTTMSHRELALEEARRRVGKMVQTGVEAHQGALEEKISFERGYNAQFRGMKMPWDTGFNADEEMARMGAVWSRMWRGSINMLASPFMMGNNLVDMPEDQLREIRANEAVARTRAAAMRQLGDQAISGQVNKINAEQLMKMFEGQRGAQAKTAIESRYYELTAKGMSKQDAQDVLTELIRDAVEPELKDSSEVAAKQMIRVMEERRASEAAASRLAGMSPEFAGADEARRRYEDAKMTADRFKAELAERGGPVTKTEKMMVEQLERFAANIKAANDVMEKEAKRRNEDAMKQESGQFRPPNINRNGNE